MFIKTTKIKSLSKVVARTLCGLTLLFFVFPVLFAQSTPPEPPTDCTIQPLQNGEQPSYSAQPIMVRKKAAVELSESFEVLVVMKNTGNMPWFSAFSGCKDQTVINLGTEADRDRPSSFHDAGVYSGWLGNNRIAMFSKRVNPGELGYFHFWAKAPNVPGIYREFFAPLVENVAWLTDKSRFFFDVNVGNLTRTDEFDNNANLVDKSFNLSLLDFTKKQIEVDLTKQNMVVKIGDFIVKNFVISSGKASTPTPRGEFSILLKQDVRVAGAAPHYIMPNFMMFKNGGYGIHALPSLKNDHGYFWTEALNHIGSPRSHGCIRLLPDDAEYVYAFADIGTKVIVSKS